MRRSTALALLLGALAGCDAASVPDAGARYVGRADGRVDRYADGGESTLLPAADGPVAALDAEAGRVVALVDAPGAGRVVIADGGSSRTVPVETPRALAVARGVAYVASRAPSALVPVFLAQAQAGPPIAVSREPEGVAVVGQSVVVANYADAFWRVVSVVSTESLTVVAANMDTCTAPRTLFADGEGEVWAVCTGRANGDGSVAEPGAVVVLDPTSGAVLSAFPADGLLGTRGWGADGAVAPRAGEAFVADGDGLLHFDTRANRLLGRLALVDGAPITAVAFDDAADCLLLGRQDSAGAATGFVSLHDRTGAKTGRFGAGAVPTAITVARGG